MPQPDLPSARSRFFTISTAAVLLGQCAALLPPPLAAQATPDPIPAAQRPAARALSSSASIVGGGGPRDAPLVLLVHPYAAMPLSDNRMQPAVGAHVEWPATDALSFVGRYEWRVDGSGPGYTCVSLDAVRRLVGNDTVSVALTGGWARWQGQDRTSLGMRFSAPMATMASGGAVLEFWADVRYAFLGVRDVTRLNGTVWASVMLVVPLNVVIRR